MADVGDNNFMRYVYRGEWGEIIPDEATHITMAEDCTFILASAFAGHPNIFEVICHEGVEKIEEYAFYMCPNLRRVIMPGVKIVEKMTFYGCEALEDVECGKLEIIREFAFGVRSFGGSLRRINLPTVRIVEGFAFSECGALTNVMFGNKLASLGERTFAHCFSLRRITLPLKDGLFAHDDTFMECRNLKHVDLVEAAELHETIAALHLEDWRNDMSEEIESINRILPNTWAGQYGDDGEGRFFWDAGGKAEEIHSWLRSVLQKIVHYKAEHRRILSEAAAAIQHHFALPHDILTNSVLPFLTLPSHTLEGENHEEAVNGVNERGVEGEQDGHEEEQGDDHDFSGDNEGEVGNEEYMSMGVEE